MSWVAVDKDGFESISTGKPYKLGSTWECEDYYEDTVWLPKGSVEKLIGRKLTWDDDPVKLEE